MISILVRNPNLCLLEFKLISNYYNLEDYIEILEKIKSVLIDIPITKYDILGQYLSLNLLIVIIVNKISSSKMKIQYTTILLIVDHFILRNKKIKISCYNLTQKA